jgi:tight adherence protein B
VSSARIVLGLAAIVILASLRSPAVRGWISSLGVLCLLAARRSSALAAAAEVPPQAGRPVARLHRCDGAPDHHRQLHAGGVPAGDSTTQAPLRGTWNARRTLVRAGVDLDRALHQTAASVRVEEMFLLASILGLGVRYGGRADLLLERVANFMRDREQASTSSSPCRRKRGSRPGSSACCRWASGPSSSFPTRATSWHVARPHRPHHDLFGAVGLQLFGTVLLYRLARLT